jgi:hypothetical protein
MTPRRSPAWTWLAPLLALAVLATYVRAAGPMPAGQLGPAGDHLRYLALAHQPFGSADPLARQAPYAWRVLTPLLVWATPWGVTTGFWLVTLLGLATATLGLEWFLSGLGLPRASAVAGGLAFVALMPACGWTLYDSCLVDPLAFACVTFALGAAVHRRGPLLVVAACLGALAKETTLLATLFALLWAAEGKDRRMLRWGLASLAGALGLLALLHATISVSPGWSYLLATSRIGGSTLARGLVLDRLVRATFGTWGILLAPALAAGAFWRRPAPAAFLGLATLQILLSFDVERVVAYAFPVVIAAACFGVEALARERPALRWPAWLGIFALELGARYAYGPTYPFSLPRGLALSIPLVAAAGTVALVLRQSWARREARRFAAG